METYNMKDRVFMLENFVGTPMIDDMVSLVVQAHELRQARTEMKVVFDVLMADMLILTDNAKARIDEMKNDILVYIRPGLEEMEDGDSVDVKVRLDEVDGDLSLLKNGVRSFPSTEVLAGSKIRVLEHK
ncbi:hypothetical protein Adt_45531 [Abeliophyllum distichum]|uniref:Uncharacterized protein n=1 Tax=Abeliophyllum distichum TaxID=126358 RepID=A0ABD1PDX7_9LAMI